MALTDDPGNLVDFRLLSGQAHDLRGAAELMEVLSFGHLLADRAFDANWPRDVLACAATKAVIPPKSNRRFPTEFDNDTLEWRHLIESFSGKLKEYKGAAMRRWKTDESFNALSSLEVTMIRTR